MSEIVERAIAVMRELPPERGEELAQMVLDCAEEPISLTREEQKALEISEAAAARGDFASDEEISGIWAKYGL